GFTFAQLMFSEREGAVVSGRMLQSRLLADSGSELVKRALTELPQQSLEAGGLYNNAKRFQGVLVLDGSTPADRGRFSILAPDLVEGQPGGARFGLEDESARLNLNTLLVVEAAASGGGRQLLMALPAMKEEIADAILDWIDTDDESREFGAELDYYSG